MNRPISILCLADIHYNSNGDMSAIDTLPTELAVFIDKDSDNLKWRPDYIVVAGDVADKNQGYWGASKFIESLKDRFGIDDNSIIMVPGNHDKQANITRKEMANDKQVFEKYCKKVDNTTKVEFGNTFALRFNDFINFSNKYNSTLYSSDILDKRLRCLSGVKVFEKDQLCFLYINTEWLYMVGRDHAKVKKGKEDISSFMKIDEDCHLCSPLIKDTCMQIQKKYPAHTVITVMHRGLEHLSWDERNVSDAATIDAIRYIICTSNIIITGHDHVFCPKPPTLIENKIQHFQLGSVGQKESVNTELSRFAEIIRLDVTQGMIEQLFIRHKHVHNSSSQWSFIKSDETYPLHTKYLPQSIDIDNSTTDTIIRAKSSSESDVKKVIFQYFQSSPECIHAEPGMYDKLTDKIKKIKKGGTAHIVVYSLASEYMKNQHNITSELNKFRDEHIEEVLLNKLIINVVVVEMPIIKKC